MIKNKIDKLLELFKQNDIGGYIVPTSDEYLSEYTPYHAKRLEFITGFSGSNGFAIILASKSLFFTDGRYTTQALAQLDQDLFSVHDIHNIAEFNWQACITKEVLIGYDPRLFTNPALHKFNQLKLKPIALNLIDQVWHNKPSKPNSTIYEYPAEYAGKTSADKIKICRDFIKTNNAKALFITDTASVCWLLNIRASDVEHSPLLLANALITEDKVFLFTDKNRLKVKDSLEYITFVSEDKTNQTLIDVDGIICFDETQCNSHFASIIKKKGHIHLKNPCTIEKACKNEVEIKHMIDGHITDAVAVCEMLSFIANCRDLPKYDEYKLGLLLTEYRARGKGYVYDSFPTICGYQENGAVIHYKATKARAKQIDGSGLLLIDSGGQYWGATTDITRTIAIGMPSKPHQDLYTQVLKGHIALACAKFPQNKVTGAHLDILARQYLWQNGLDYQHGTGHGVGSFLSVHEGPQSISAAGFSSMIKSGMIVSNEPGYYEPGSFGIRIENLIYAKESQHTNGFIEFVNLTLVPYSKALIDMKLLSDSEISYLRDYYNQISTQVLPKLSISAQVWLKTEIDTFN